MTTGLSGSYAVNGTNFTLQPTTFRFVQREALGYDGNGHPIYDEHRDCELTWELMSPSDSSQVINAYSLVQNTGTLSFDLPEYGSNQLRKFKTYSGTTIDEPEIGEGFMGYWSNVRLVIHLVRAT